MTFSREKVTFTILKVTFSDEKVVFSQQFSREFNRKVYLFGKACQASVSNDHLFLANGHLSTAHCHPSAFNYTKSPICVVFQRKVLRFRFFYLSLRQKH